MEEYVEYLYGLGLAKATIRMYKANLKRAMAWAEDQGVDLDHPKPSDLAALRETVPETAASLRQLRCALEHWWTLHNITDAPVKALRVPKKPTPVWRGLEPDDARLLAETALGWQPEGTAVLIGLYMGLRRSEIASMRWDRFSPDYRLYTVTGKGAKTATIPVPDDLRRLLMPLRGGYVWLFPGTHRLHVNPATIWDWTRRVADEAGIRVTTHQLRHTLIGAICDTAGIRVAQEIARHARIDTTQIYTRVTQDQMRDAMEQVSWLRGKGWRVA